LRRFPSLEPKSNKTSDTRNSPPARRPKGGSRKATGKWAFGSSGNRPPPLTWSLEFEPPPSLRRSPSVYRYRLSIGSPDYTEAGSQTTIKLFAAGIIPHILVSICGFAADVRKGAQGGLVRIRPAKHTGSLSDKNGPASAGASAGHALARWGNPLHPGQKAGGRECRRIRAISNLPSPGRALLWKAAGAFPAKSRAALQPDSAYPQNSAPPC
jgi:hypothetical protein